MSNPKTYHCIVDDTALTTNLDEIAPWVEGGLVALVVPLYTLGRLHLLKKDASQIGQNARKAVKFLDQITSTPNLKHDPVVIQGPDDEYADWTGVEARYLDSVIQRNEAEPSKDTAGPVPASKDNNAAKHETLDKQLHDFSLSSEDLKTSPISTPPLSPSNSEPQSNKTSPEVRCATISKHDATPIPPTLKALINFVVWYAYESKEGSKDPDLLFLTNSADAAQIAKDFGISPKTIHQLRATIPAEQCPSRVANQSLHKKKPSSRSLSFKDDSEHRTLFSYNDASSEDEELLFKPRARDLPRPGSSGRGSKDNAIRGRSAMHSPSNSINASNAPKPQVPVEEIDPDSFDRGNFARGSIPLANVGNQYGPSNGQYGRSGHRNFSSPANRGGGFRGLPRGRGRGRLFVP